MTRRTSFLTRCFALVLALVMTFSGSNLGIVLQAYAYALGDSYEASGKLGSLMVQEYGIEGDLAKLLESDLVADNGDYSISFPQDIQLTIDKDNKKVTVPGAQGWSVAVTLYAADESGHTETIDPAVGTYSYEGPFYVEAEYTNAPAATNTAAQQALVDNILSLKAAYDKTAEFVAVMDDGVNKLQPELGPLGQYLPDTAVAVKHGNAMSDLVYLNTMYEQAASQYGKEHDYVKSLVGVTTEVEPFLSYAYMPVENLLVSLPALSTAFAEYKAEAETLIANGQGTDQMVMGVKLIGAAINSIDAYVERLKQLSRAEKGSWADISEYVTADVLAGETSELSSWLSAEWAVPATSDISFTKVLTADTGIETLTVNGSLTYYDAEGVKQTYTPATQTKKVEAGLTAEEKESKVASLIDTVVLDMSAEADAEGIDLTHFSNDGNPAVEVIDNVWNVTFAPKTYTVTINGNAGPIKEYGSKMNLETHPNQGEMIYEFEVVDAEGNVAQYEEGQSFIVTGNMTVTRTENKPYVTNKFYTMVTEEFLKDEQVVADILNALTTDYTVKYRMPTKGTLLTLADDGTLTMRTADASYGDNKWTANGYSIDGGDVQTLADTSWNVDKTLTGITDDVKSIEVKYDLLIASGENVKTHLGNVDAVITDAQEEKAALESLKDSKSDMEQLTYTKLGSIATLADGDPNLTEDQQQVFIDMQDNCYDTDKNLKVYNLVVKYENGGLSAFYQDAANFLATVQQLDGYLVRLFGTTQAEKDGLKAFLDSLEEGAGYDELVSMKESVAKAAAALELNVLINKDASMATLGDALATAVAQNKTTSTIETHALIVNTSDTQPGKNEVTLTIELQAGNIIRSIQKVYTKGTTLTAADMDDVVKGQNADFFSGDYAKYYTNNYAGTSLTLTGNKKLTFNWEYKTYTVAIDGEASQEFNVYDNTITLPAPTDAKRYEYKVGDVVVPVADKARTYPISKTEIDALFATGSYTVEKDVYKDVSFGYTLVAPIQGVDKSAPVSITREMKVGEGYKLTEDDVDFLKLKASRGLKDQGIRQLHYYDQTGYTPESYIGISVTEDTTNITYTLKVIPYTVTFVENGETVGTATISIDNLVVNLPESSDEAYYYEYLLDGVTLQDTKHEFLTPGDYTITRVTHKNDVTKYDDAARVLEKIAESDFIAKLEKGEAVKGILKSGVFTTKDVTVADDQGNLSTVKAFDENIKFNIPKNESLSLVGTKLSIPVVEGNKALRLNWNPTKYVFNTGAEGTLTGASDIVMDESVAMATVTYEMVLANNAKVIEKLAAIDDLVADGDKKIAAMDALLDLEEDLKTLSTALKTVENYTDFITDDAEYEAVSAILADMLTNCFTQNPRGGPDKLLLLDQVQKYATAKDENAGLAYIYANLNDINDAIGNLVMYMNQLKAYPNALDEMGAHEDIRDVLGEGQTLSGLLDEYSVTIADYRADLMVPGIINNSMDLTEFGKNLQALSIGYTPIATAEAVKDQVVVLTKEATQIGEGVLVAEVVLSVEGYPAITIIDGPYETQTGSYTLTAADLASLNGKIDAALAGLSNFNANYYATNHKTITALTINGESEALVYEWTLKPIMVNDHEGNQTALKYTLAGTTMEIDLPAAPEGLIYDYYIGNNKYPVGVSSISIDKLYTDLGTNLVITCVATESLTYTIVLNVEGLEEAYDLELGYKKVGDKPAAVDPAEVNTAIIAALAELKVNTKFYTTDYAQNKLATSLTENKTDSFNWTYKNFKVTIDGQAHEEVSLKDLEITLPTHQDTDKYYYKYVIDADTITVDGAAGTYTFTRDQLDMLFENDTFDITRRQIKKVDGSEYDHSGSVMAVIGDSALLKDHPAGDILSSGALNEEEFVLYNDPDANELVLKDQILTIDQVTADGDELFWGPVSYQAQSATEATKITSIPFELKMDPADDFVDINFELEYLTAAQVNEKLAIADSLVAEAIEQKDTLDYLSSDDMIANTDEKEGKLTQLSKTMMDNVALVIEGGEFSTDKAQSESHKAHYLTIFKNMAQTTENGGCYPNDGGTYLTLHGMLTNYKTAGLINFYQNAVAYRTEVIRLGNYLEQLMDPAHKDGLKYFMEKEGFGSYFDMISDVQQTISDAAEALKLNAAIDPNSTNMSSLVTALEEAMALEGGSGYQNVAGTGTAMKAYATVRKANDGRITLTVTLKADGTTNSAFVSMTRKMDADHTYTLTADDIAELQALVDAKAAELGFDAGDFVKYYEEPVLSDMIGVDVTPDNYNFEKAWTYKNFTVNVGGVEQTINLGNLTINLPKSEDDKYRNEYEINGVVYTEDIGTYTFKKADLDTLFGENGETAFEVAVTKINKAEEKLVKFVNGLNKEVGAGAFTLVGPEGDRTGIVANIPADGLMGMATYLMTSSEYTYVGLNGQPLLSGGMHMQALIDAMLSDAKFGNQTIIDMGNDKPAHVMDASMQLGVDAENLQYNALTFTVNITSVPSNMEANVDTIAGYLSDLKNVFWFNGNPETGKLDVHFNMGPATISGRSVNLEKLYEAYLTALLVTYDMQKVTLDEMNQVVAFQLLKDYTACLTEDDVTVTTLENTLAKLGQDVDLSKYSKYFELAQKFHRDSVVAEDGTSVTESFPIQALLDMSGMDVSAYESMLGMIFEHKNNVDLTVGVNAILENANKPYDAVILDPRSFDKNNVTSVQNVINYTTDLTADAQNIVGESVIMLLNNVKGDIVLNDITILDLNGYSIDGTVKANGRTIIIDSADSGYVKNVTGNATILGGTYGNDITAMLRPGYAQSNGAVTVDIVSMLNEGYFTSIPFVAAEIAVDFALNNYATAAFYACAGGHNVHTIFELCFDDFISLIDREDSLKQNAVNIVNTILDMVTMDGGLDQLINEIAAMLIDVDRIVELTKNGGTLGTIQIATRPWKFETKHIHDEDYLTVGLTVDPDAALKHADAAIKIPAIENNKIQRVLNELADIAAGTAGNPESYFEIDLKDITLADNAVNIGGGLKTYISLNFCGDNDGETDLTYHGTYNRVLAVIVAFANDKLTKDIIKNGEIVELNELMAVTTVGEFFDAIKNAVNSDKPFDYMVEKVGARLTEEEIAKLSKVYEKFQAGAGKVLAKVETKAPLAATPLSFLVDNNGVLELKTDVYSGIKNVNYRGYGLNFNLTETQVGLKIKFCNLPNEYRIVFQKVGADSDKTVGDGLSAFINDVAWEMDDDTLWLGKEKPAWLGADKAGGNIAVTYTHSILELGGQKMLTPEQMFLWKISLDPTDSTGKTYIATPVLTDALDFVGSSVWLHNDGVNGLRFAYTVSPDAERVLGDLGYKIAQYNGGNDHGLVIDWADNTEGKLGVVREDRANMDCRRLWEDSWQAFYGEEFRVRDEYLNRDQHIRFYMMLEHEATGEIIPLYSGVLVRDIRIVAEQNDDGTYPEPYATYVKNLIAKAKQVNGETVG